MATMKDMFGQMLDKIADQADCQTEDCKESR